MVGKVIDKFKVYLTALTPGQLLMVSAVLIVTSIGAFALAWYFVRRNVKAQSDRAIREKYREALQRIVSDFEADYTAGGVIVDNPDRSLLSNYNTAKLALVIGGDA